MQYFSVGISFVALTIAVYGIFERQRAVYSAIRVRLTELLGFIEELNIDELKYEDGQTDGAGSEPRPQSARFAFAGRRALLTYQALALLDRLGQSWFGSSEKITAAERVSLATSLRWCGDLPEARKQWQLSVTTKGYTPPVVLAAGYRGLADALFEEEDYESARDNYRRAAECEAGETVTEQSGRFNTYLEWLDREMTIDGGIPEEPARRAYEIAMELRWGPTLLESLREHSRTTIFVDDQYREVGLEELLEASMADLLTGATNPPT